MTDGNNNVPSKCTSVQKLSILMAQKYLQLTKQMHSDSKKRSSFVTLLFGAGDLRR